MRSENIFQECLSLSRHVCFRCKFCASEIHFSLAFYHKKLECFFEFMLHWCKTTMNLALPRQWIKDLFQLCTLIQSWIAGQLAGFFSIFVTNKMLCNTHVKIKKWQWSKKRRQERKKEVGALMAGHPRLVTQPVLNPADRA